MTKIEDLAYFCNMFAPSGFKYALSLVPRETDSMEKVLKRRRQEYTNQVDASIKAKRHKIQMDGFKWMVLKIIYASDIILEVGTCQK